MNDTKQVASEILRQLGGNKFLAMTGAKELANFDAIDSKRDWPGLSFRLPIGKIAVVCIALSPDDDYTLQFLPRGGLYVKELNGIYVDRLKSIIEHYTGLRLSL